MRLEGALDDRDVRADHLEHLARVEGGVLGVRRQLRHRVGEADVVRLEAHPRERVGEHPAGVAAGGLEIEGAQEAEIGVVIDPTMMVNVLQTNATKLYNLPF